MASRLSARFTSAPAFPAAVFVVALVAAVVVTDAARLTVPALRDHENLVDRSGRPSYADYYLANDVGGPVDHHVLFFGTDADVLARLRAAEVLFVGNSRLMFALRPDVLRPFFEAEGLTYYVMGFGFREADRFPLAIIRKFDLRPRLVVANVDGFFGQGLSPWAEVVNRDTPFAARKLQAESEAAHEARRVVHRIVPNWLQLFGLPGFGARRPFIAYRSRLDGTWEVSPWPEATEAFLSPSLEGSELGRGEIAAARAFKAELDQRGTRLVLTRVPSPEPMPGAGPARFAELLGVPLVVDDVPALTSHDHSHLSRGSALDWTRAVVTALAPFLPASPPGGADRR